MNNKPIFDSGERREGKTRFRTAGVARAADRVETYPGDTIGTVTERAYGANTPELRERIARANVNLDGEVNAPR